MKKFLLIFILLSYHLNAQIPDYSNLTKKEKLIFLNGYGFIKTIKGDTIYGVVKGYQSKNYLAVYKKNKIRVEYPRKLEKYKYLKEIPLSEIEMYYSVGYRTFKYVKKVNGKRIILNKTADGKVKVYERIVMRNDLVMNFLGATGMVKEIYFEDEQGKITLIFGKDKYGDVQNKKEIKENFIDFFKKKYNRSVLEKVKPREIKIMEFVKKYNEENI